MLGPGLLIDRRYRVEDLLGRGGMADVYRATDTQQSDTRVAVKLLRGAHDRDERCLETELAVLTRLDHPGVIELYGTGMHDGFPYLVLELIDGPTLAARLREGVLGVEPAIELTQQLAGAIAHAHGVGVVHRDIKPSNVLFDSSGRGRLTDFGIARLIDASSVTTTGMVAGTIPYLAPEQVTGDPVGPPADVYALGLVALESVTGARCYPGSRVEAALARLHRPPVIPTSLPGWLALVLAAMTAVDPRDRPRAQAVETALRTRSAEPVLPAGVLDLPTLRRTVRSSGGAGDTARHAVRRGRVVAAAAASIVLAVPALLLAGRDGQPAETPASAGFIAAEEIPLATQPTATPVTQEAAPATTGTVPPPPPAAPDDDHSQAAKHTGPTNDDDDTDDTDDDESTGKGHGRGSGGKGKDGRGDGGDADERDSDDRGGDDD